MRSRHAGYSVMDALGFLAVVLMLTSLSGCDKPQAPATALSPAAESVGKPLTDEECRVAAEAIGKAVNSHDVAALDKMIDWDAIYQRCTEGVDAPEQYRKNFIKGLDSTRLNGKGIASTIVDVAKKGGSYTLLRTHYQEKRPCVLFRLLLAESGVNYHDYILARRPDGTIKAVDLYVYLSGEPISQSFRRGYIQSVAKVGGGFVDRLTGADKKYVEYFDKLGKMGEAVQSGQFQEVLNAYQSLPPELKKEKNVLIMRIHSAQNLGQDAEYTQAIEDYRQAYPNDPSIDIMSIDYYLMKKQYNESLECVNRLDKAVLGDPYLHTLRASLHSEANDLVAARADLKKAFEADPELVDAYWCLITLSLKDNQYDETLKTLRLIRDKFHIEISDLTTVEPYKGFVKSTQYQEWLKDKPAPEDKADGKKPEGEPKN